MRFFLGRSAAAAGMLAVALAFGTSEAAAEHIKLGLVRVANSGPTYIAIEKGYFAEEGLDPEIVFFEGGGVPIAVAAVSGDVDFGETATSGSLFSLARPGRHQDHRRRDARGQGLPQFRARGVQPRLGRGAQIL